MRNKILIGVGVLLMLIAGTGAAATASGRGLPTGAGTVAPHTVPPNPGGCVASTVVRWGATADYSYSRQGTISSACMNVSVRDFVPAGGSPSLMRVRLYNAAGTGSVAEPWVVVYPDTAGDQWYTLHATTAAQRSGHYLYRIEGPPNVISWSVVASH